MPRPTPPGPEGYVLPDCRERAAAAAAKYGLPQWLVWALVIQESSCRPYAVGRLTNHGYALGIAQIIPKFHPGIDPWNPDQALDYTASRLAEWYGRFQNSYALSVAAWHSGEGRVAKSGGCVPGTSDVLIKTSMYVRQVLARAGLPFDVPNPSCSSASVPPSTTSPFGGAVASVSGATLPVQTRGYLVLAIALILLVLGVAKWGS